MTALTTRRFAVACFPLLAAGLVVGWSRVFLGLHFPFDILAALPVALEGVLGARALRTSTMPAVPRLLYTYDRVARALRNRWSAAHNPTQGNSPFTMRILLIEDDAMIGKAVQHGLVQAGFAVDWASDGRAAELSLANGVYDLTILDLGLPGKDGMTILATLRALGNSMPVLIASARDTVRDRIAGLEAGADDYVLKPFDLDELVARVRALLRRHAGSGSPLLRFGALVLDPMRRSVMKDEQPIELSAKEFAVLEALMQRPGAVLSREKLEESVYGWGEEVGSNAIEVHLHHLRKKLGMAAIKNVRGVGYRVTEG